MSNASAERHGSSGQPRVTAEKTGSGAKHSANAGSSGSTVCRRTHRQSALDSNADCDATSTINVNGSNTSRLKAGPPAQPAPHSKWKGNSEDEQRWN